jgi:hypothetical protein
MTIQNQGLRSSISRLVSFLFLLVLCGCSVENDVALDQEFDRFRNYLNTNLQTAAPVDGHFYIVIPQKACYGCSVNILEKMLLLENCDKATIIVSYNSPKQASALAGISGFNNLLLDSRGLIDRLNIGINGVTVLKMGDHSIDETIEITAENYESVFDVVANSCSQN